MTNIKYKFTVQESKRLRVIIDSDAACEADDCVRDGKGNIL